jgi:hypothetical protein
VLFFGSLAISIYAVVAIVFVEGGFRKAFRRATLGEVARVVAVDAAADILNHAAFLMPRMDFLSHSIVEKSQVLFVVVVAWFMRRPIPRDRLITATVGTLGVIWFLIGSHSQEAAAQNPAGSAAAATAVSPLIQWMGISMVVSSCLALEVAHVIEQDLVRSERVSQHGVLLLTHALGAPFSCAVAYMTGLPLGAWTDMSSWTFKLLLLYGAANIAYMTVKMAAHAGRVHPIVHSSVANLRLVVKVCIGTGWLAPWPMHVTAAVALVVAPTIAQAAWESMKGDSDAEDKQKQRKKRT